MEKTRTIGRFTPIIAVLAVALLAAGAFAVVSPAFAHEGELHGDEAPSAEANTMPDEPRIIGGLGDQFRAATLEVLTWAGIVLGATVALAVIWMKGPRPMPESARRWLFGIIVFTVSATTVFIAGGTVYLNVVSLTGGPVHWHADFRVSVCGEELDLVNPTGVSNRVGSPVLHEHGDNRIHVEGVVTNGQEASLGTFLQTVGGTMNPLELLFPAEGGMVHVRNGDRCADGSQGTLQTFVWETLKEDGRSVARQRLLGGDAASYVIKPEPAVPPGDCLVIEFGPAKDRTGLICRQYEVAAARGEIVIEN